MTDREKLTALIRHKQDCGLTHNGTGQDFVTYNAELADYLISNGVKVQRWIPVTERLPGVGRRVLVTDGKHVSFGYDLCGGEENLWYAQFPCNDGEVTHWMPLPEPPKEGE